MKTIRRQVIKIGLLISITLSSCGQNNPIQILGSWSGCMFDKYYELHFYEDIHLAFYGVYPDDPFIREYQISSDSLFIEYFNAEEGMTFAFRIVELTQSKLILEKNEEIYSFNRLLPEQSPELSAFKHEKDQQVYIKIFEKRHKQSACYQKEPKLDLNNVGEGSLELTEEDMDISDLFDSSDTSESKEKRKKD